MLARVVSGVAREKEVLRVAAIGAVAARGELVLAVGAEERRAIRVTQVRAQDRIAEVLAEIGIERGVVTKPSADCRLSSAEC